MAKKASKIEDGMTASGRKAPVRSVFVVQNEDKDVVGVTAKSEDVFRILKDNPGSTAEKFVLGAQE